MIEIRVWGLLEIRGKGGREGARTEAWVGRGERPVLL